MLRVEAPADGAQRWPEFLKCLLKVYDVIITLCLCFYIKQPLPLCLWLLKVKVVCKSEFIFRQREGKSILLENKRNKKTWVQLPNRGAAPV